LKEGAAYDYLRIMEDENFALSFFEYLSLMGLDKLRELKSLSLQCLDLAGDWVEFGVYKGGSLGLLALQLKLANSSKKIIGIDTFEGHPFDNVYQGKVIPRKEYFWDTSIELVQRALYRAGVLDFVSLQKGVFDEVVEALGPKLYKVSLVHIDCDLYQSTKTAFGWAMEHLVQDGLAIIDDYGTDAFGVKPAVDEFVNPAEIQVYGGTHFWRKS